MALEISVNENESISVDEFVELFKQGKYDSSCAEALADAASLLRKVSNNKIVLFDYIKKSLESRYTSGKTEALYTPQVIVLHRDDSLFLRGAIWPAATSETVHASGGKAFYYDVPHDHNFSFISVGHLGPGYKSTTYEYDYDSILGFEGEAATLTSTGIQQLKPGEILLYRAHQDIHCQHAPDELSVSINIMDSSNRESFTEQYVFDQAAEHVVEVAQSHSLPNMLKLYALLDPDQKSVELLQGFASKHPSTLVRLAAVNAVAETKLAGQEKARILRQAVDRGTGAARDKATTLLQQLESA